MIGYLEGIVREASEKRILLVTGSGVGYEIMPTGSLLAEAKPDKPFSAEIFTVVREQEITLYGFASADEKALFEKLIGVSGIGPKTASQMVSTPIDQFLDAVEKGDVAFITKMPGIGKKTAERLIVELRGKLDLTPAAEATNISPAHAEASEALQNLGYDKATIIAVFESAPAEASTEELVKFFLSAK